MVELRDDHPGYGFEINKGYGTPEHLEAVARLGLCPEHRRSFSPCGGTRAPLLARASAPRPLVRSAVRSRSTSLACHASLAQEVGPMTDEAQEARRRGEDAAAAYLERVGMTIVERNWRCPAGEIDIVALDGETLVLCEVKTRRTHREGDAGGRGHAGEAAALRTTGRGVRAARRSRRDGRSGST